MRNNYGAIQLLISLFFFASFLASFLCFIFGIFSLLLFLVALSKVIATATVVAHRGDRKKAMIQSTKFI
jgi:hypothetical protein